MEITENNIEFYADNILIKGVLHLPAVETPPIVIGSHGLEGSKNSAKQTILSQLLPNNGIGYLRFDHRGCGDSHGDFLKDTSVKNRASDFISAVKYIQKTQNISGNIGIFGSSLGGSTCIEAFSALMQLDVKVCATVITAAPVKSKTIGTAPDLPIEFLENMQFDLTLKTEQMSTVLIFHGKADEIVPVENAHAIYNSVKEPRKLILFENGDHQTSLKKDQKIFEKLTLEWFKAALCG